MQKKEAVVIKFSLARSQPVDKQSANEGCDSQLARQPGPVGRFPGFFRKRHNPAREGREHQATMRPSGMHSRAAPLEDGW